MAQVRIPKTAESLLPFCRTWSGRNKNACFATYAEMMVFAAGCGFHFLEGDKPPQCVSFVSNNQPNPIDLMIFKNESQQAYPLILMLALAALKKHEAIRDEERLCKLIEDYGAVGLNELAKRLEMSGADDFHVELARLLQETSRTVLKKDKEKL